MGSKEDDNSEGIHLEGINLASSKDTQLETDSDELFSLFIKEIDEENKPYQKVNRNGFKKIDEISKYIQNGEFQVNGDSKYLDTSKVLINTDSLGSADEEILRLTSRVFVNSFEILKLPVNSSYEAIRRQYRKLSLLIHPDKCSHKSAREAFDILNRGYEELQKSESRLKYKQVWKQAEEIVLRERKKQMKLMRKKQRKGLISREEIEMEEQSKSTNELQKEIIDMCEKILKEYEEKREYSERCKAANEQFERQRLEEIHNEEKRRCIQRKLWSASMDERVGNWREYKRAVEKGTIKLDTFKGVKLSRQG
ncbi:DnaJ domain-containing protein [Cryptosporidium muris RN66]|uniref:DnaJ domain-containing protein n=1 Tax=Cryptosporidium muris (strain RN66) TaxID=441375 RepID=B6AAN0_CRYMR|nr:DnaJ domain-containing protein [Cryptosporidium muris RN66]EEA05432.1 DnaJ domain-containing protein [Cryptosporidium muris RN66]|eukprot:XP_002139781.1 DnaJ domain-containing protein [Cryptosporidium muris RN66]